jgi:hypothetical protein
MKANRIARQVLTGAALALTFGMTGCASMTSTLYSHDGCQTCDKKRKHLKGVPTTLEVPTDIRVSVYKTTYGTVLNGIMTPVDGLSTVEIDYDIIKQKEIYAVDFKRPAAGKLEYQLTFDKDKQYITKIVNKSTDETIAKVSDLVATMIRTLPKAAAGFSTGLAPGAPMPENLIPFQKVVASEVFGLNEPGLEQRIQDFLDYYVNQCNPCVGGACPYPGPPPGCVNPGHGCKVIR